MSDFPYNIERDKDVERQTLPSVSFSLDLRCKATVIYLFFFLFLHTHFIIYRHLPNGSFMRGSHFFFSILCNFLIFFFFLPNIKMNPPQVKAGESALLVFCDRKY